MVESCIYSHWPFNDRIETAPRKAKESGAYTVTGLVNTLSLADVATVVSDWTAAGWLIPVRIKAGGEPSIETLRLHRSDDASSVMSSILGPVKARLIASGILPNDRNNYCVTHSALMYRHLSGQFVRDRVEILHCAEGYQLTGATPTTVQYCPSQGIKEVNNSQQFCAQFSLMWCKTDDGSLIPPNEAFQYLPADDGQPPQLNPHWYTGPTQCPHRAVGCPCYGPYPHVIQVPTFMTPKREGHRSKRGGLKKGRKEDTTQKKLEDYFSGAANNSLQLTN